jgi:hypothetical protein
VKSPTLWIKITNIDEYLKCQLCNRIVFTKTGFKNHQSKEHPNPEVSLDVSIEEKILKDGTEDCLSQKNDQIKRTFDCQWCDKRFSHKSCLTITRHVTIKHDKLKRFQCEICQEVFRCKVELKNHTFALHAEPKLYQCPLCQKTFANISRMNRHTHSVHEKLKNFRCQQCDMRFSQNCTLQVHIKWIHQILNSFQCQICNKSFGPKGNLKYHENRLHKI